MRVSFPTYFGKQFHFFSFSALTLLVGQQEGIRPVKNMGDGGGGRWLVRMEWRTAGWSVCLPLRCYEITMFSVTAKKTRVHAKTQKQLPSGNKHYI